MTVRHVESMIRMSEANAKMHLRDQVRQDDLDVAISVALESFINANKLSVMKSLRRKFQKYMSSHRDNHELLHHILRTLVNEQLKYNMFKSPSNRRGGDFEAAMEGTEEDPFAQSQSRKEVEIDADEFEIRARELNIHDVISFYESAMFLNNGYKLVTRKERNGRQSSYIVKTMA
jgi:DNA replication licensing factor MCM2